MPPENTSRSIHHHLARRRFGYEAERTEVERPQDVVAVVQRRQDHDRDRGAALAQVGQNGEAVPIRQAEIKQDQVKVGVLLDESHRLTAIRRLQHNRVGIQFPYDAAQRVADQGVIVDRKNLHPEGSSRDRAGEYFNHIGKTSGHARGVGRPCSAAHIRYNDIISGMIFSETRTSCRNTSSFPRLPRP
jgi:hypothetical protein